MSLAVLCLDFLLWLELRQWWTEIKVIETRLQIAIGKEYRKLVVESDSMVAIKYIYFGCSSQHPHFRLVGSIQTLPASCLETLTTHVLSEANQIADMFAKHGLYLHESNTIFYSLPTSVVDAFKAGFVGISFLEVSSFFFWSCCPLSL